MLAAQLVIMSQSIKFSAMCKMTNLQSKCSLRETTTIFAAMIMIVMMMMMMMGRFNAKDDDNIFDDDKDAVHDGYDDERWR